MFTQENSEGLEKPIAFFSKDLRDATLKYEIMEKKAFALVKAIKDFRVYILHAHIISFVQSAVVKDVLTQNDPDGKRVSGLLLYWSMILKYNLLNS